MTGKMFLQLGLSLFLLTGCQLRQPAPEVPRKRVSDTNLSGFKDPTMKKRLMVMPFLDANDQRDPQIRESARRAFIADLNRSGQLIASDSTELRIDNEKYLQNGEYNLKEVSKHATQLGVNSILEGKIVDLKVKRS